MAETNGAATATPCTCRNGVAGETDNHALAAAENGDPSAAAGSAEAAEEVTDGGQGKTMEVDQDMAVGNHSSAPAKPSDLASAAAKDVAVGQDTGMVSNSSVPENGGPSAAAGSAKAEDVTNGFKGKKIQEVDQDKVMGKGNHSSAPVKPSDLVSAAAKDVTIGGQDTDMVSNSSVPSATVNTPDATRSSPIASKTPAAVLARRLFVSPARRVSDTVSTSNLITPPRAALAVLTLLALWLAADNPRRAVWTFSTIGISYTTLWTIWLTAAIQARTVLVSVSYVALVAISVTHLSSATGIFVLLLDTAYAAGLCGYALAEYRQRKGFERAADELHSKKELKQVDRAVIAMVSFYSTVASMACTAGAAWVIYYSVDTYWVVVVLSLLIDVSLFCWTALVAVHLLHGALLADDCIAFIYWGVVLLLVPDLLLSYLFGNAIGMLVHPLGVMGVAGLLGYNLGLYVQYKQMLEGDDGNNK